MIRGSETVTIKRLVETGEVDKYNMPITSTVNITVRNCLIGFGTTDEPIDVTRNPADIQLTIYMPKGTVVQDGDVFIIRQTEFIKDGVAQEWINPNYGLEVGVIIGVRKRHG
jgi:hypothetical protein